MNLERKEQVIEVLNGIEMVGTRLEEWDFSWFIGSIGAQDEGGWYIQCSFERPDANGEGISRGFGRKWVIDAGATLEQAVFTAWLAIQQIVIHELHESFTCKVGDERVRLFDPHKSLEHIAVGSRRV